MYVSTLSYPHRTSKPPLKTKAKHHQLTQPNHRTRANTSHPPAKNGPPAPNSPPNTPTPGPKSTRTPTFGPSSQPPGLRAVRVHQPVPGVERGEAPTAARGALGKAPAPDDLHGVRGHRLPSQPHARPGARADIAFFNRPSFRFFYCFQNVLFGDKTASDII